MTNKLLRARDKDSVGTNWPAQFVSRTLELKMKFSRAKDYQRAKQEDPVVIGDWFRLVSNTKAKYGI